MEASQLERDILKIGDLARITGKTVRTLHFYEELEILRPVERTRGGFRLYEHDAVERVWLIEKLQVLGLSLPEIRELLLDWEGTETAPDAARKIREVLFSRREQLRLEIERLKGLEIELSATVEYLNHCTTGCGSRAGLHQACPSCNHATEDHNRPRIISGLYPI